MYSLTISKKERIHPTPYYIWRTRSDGRVRASHAANNGKIFAWDNPPPTGNPGEEWGCRCWGEPYYDYESSTQSWLLVEAALEKLLSGSQKWDNFLMSAHYYVGKGRSVTIDEIGHEYAIRNHYEKYYFSRFIAQIRDKAGMAPDGVFSDDFTAVYSFYNVLFSYRQSTVHGVFTGTITSTSDNLRRVEGVVSIQFYDRFTDPLSIRQLFVWLRNHIPFTQDITESDLNALVKHYSEVGGVAYDINGEWSVILELIL
jgi:hypothetical protein